MLKMAEMRIMSTEVTALPLLNSSFFPLYISMYSRVAPEIRRNAMQFYI